MKRTMFCFARLIHVVDAFDLNPFSFTDYSIDSVVQYLSKMKLFTSDSTVVFIRSFAF